MRDSIREKFLRYTKINTASNGEKADFQTPSTEGQWDLLRLLKSEMEELGIDDIYFDDKGYLIGRIPPSDNKKINQGYVGFMAHVDTSEDVLSDVINPVCHERYDGSPLRLKEGITLFPEEEPDLLK